ncbi:MAG: hypothetical protein IKF17_06110 [Clostridia bacterium]|nr:hypothetical protein [Clostridia bacterium]
MENASDALHMAFGVLIFVLALSITMSSFSIVRVAADTILYNSDRETGYTYVKYQDESGNLQTERIVGKETIIPTLNRIFMENYIIRFRDRNGNAMTVYKYDNIDMSEINLENISANDKKEFINALFSGKDTKIGNKDLKPNPFYGTIIKGNNKFKETLGVYYQEDLQQSQIDDVNKTKKRVITYTQI